MRWHAVIFDLDDTLYLERGYVLSGFHAVATWLACECGQDPEDLYGHLARWFEHGVRGNTFDLLLERLSLRRNGLVDELIRIYREHKPRISPSPEVPALLAALEHKCALGLVSDGYSFTQRRKLKALGLEGHFKALVISDDLPDKAHKPSPRLFQVALEELGIPPEKAVYIADNPQKDFLGARRAGLASVRVRRPCGLYSHLEPADKMHAPDLEVADLWHLEGYLASLRV